MKLWAFGPGKVNMKAVIILIIAAIVIYVALSFIPVFSVPFDLENKTKSSLKDWLRLSPMEKTDAKVIDLEKEIKKMVKDHLRDHEYNAKDLKVTVSAGKNRATVRCPYTVVINPVGIRLTFDKKLDVEETRSSF